MTEAECPICGDEYETVGAVRDHAWDVHEVCHYCGTEVDHREALYTHWLDDHEDALITEDRKRAERNVGERTLCPVCDQRFARDTAVRDHTWDAHDACFLCGEEFRTRDELSVHWLALHEDQLSRDDRDRAASAVGPLTFGNRLAHQGPVDAVRNTRLSRRRLVGGGAIAAVAGIGGVAGSQLLGSSSGSRGAQLGTSAPDAMFTTLSGETKRLSDFEGQKVMFWLFATWCPSCKQGAKVLQDNSDQLGNMQIIGLKTAGNAGRSGPSVGKFVESFAPSLLDDDNWTWGTAGRETTQTYNPQNRPDIYYLIDQESTIQARNTAPAASIDRIRQFAGGQ